MEHKDLHLRLDLGVEEPYVVTRLDGSTHLLRITRAVIPQAEAANDGRNRDFDAELDTLQKTGVETLLQRYQAAKEAYNGANKARDSIRKDFEYTTEGDRIFHDGPPPEYKELETMPQFRFLNQSNPITWYQEMKRSPVHLNEIQEHSRHTS
ncbi:MAG: hypothetical protein Q9179_007799 [Wetmoreana sp. 5 TL-2023]